MDPRLLDQAREIAAIVAGAGRSDERSLRLGQAILRGEMDRSTIVVAAYYGIRRGVQYAASTAKWRLPDGAAAKHAILSAIRDDAAIVAGIIDPDDFPDNGAG